MRLVMQYSASFGDPTALNHTAGPDVSSLTSAKPRSALLCVFAPVTTCGAPSELVEGARTESTQRRRRFQSSCGSVRSHCMCVPPPERDSAGLLLKSCESRIAAASAQSLVNGWLETADWRPWLAYEWSSLAATTGWMCTRGFYSSAERRWLTG